METKKAKQRPISPEKRAEYVRNRKVKDEERRQQHRKGDVNDRRLSFVENIIKMKGMNWRQVSAQCGISPQMLSWYVTKDDCYLSILKNILTSIGIKTDLSLSNSNKQKTPKKYQYMVVGNIMNYDTDNGSMVDKYPAFIKECIAAGGQMKFLADYIVNGSYRVKDICSKIGVTESTLRYYFTQDDIKVSRVYEIADALGEKLIWELNEK